MTNQDEIDKEVICFCCENLKHNCFCNEKKKLHYVPYKKVKEALSLTEKQLYCEMCKDQKPKGFFKTIPICGDCYLRVIEDYEKQISDLKSEKNSNIENAKQRIYSKFNHFKPSTKFIIGKIIDEELKKELKK